MILLDLIYSSNNLFEQGSCTKHHTRCQEMEAQTRPEEDAQCRDGATGEGLVWRHRCAEAALKDQDLKASGWGGACRGQCDHGLRVGSTGAGGHGKPKGGRMRHTQDNTGV